MEMTETNTSIPQRNRISRDIPPSRIEGPVTKIASQEEQVMSDWPPLAAPLRDPIGGEGVAKVHQAHRATFAAGNNIPGQSLEHLLRPTCA